LDKLECPREGGAGTELLSKSNYGIGLASSFFWSDRAIFKVAVAFMPREHWFRSFHLARLKSRKLMVIYVSR
jgi:hypothetical protein